jgi:beta-xylosidase
MTFTKEDYDPLMKCDYPDPDVIRVGDTYYLISTTMYFMPGGEILRSHDLIHWEHAAFVYDRLDSTPAQKKEGESNIYGCGMWAASLRYHKGTFYVCFVCNDTGKTYLYRSENIEGPWRKSEIEGFYHDCSLLFDDDNRVYIAYGNRDIHVTELDAELKGPKKGGVDVTVLVDRDDAPLGYEGSHFYKINGKYYLFFIHIDKSIGMRTECCFVADRPEGEYKGGEIFEDDTMYKNMGAAQGGIVDTPSGKWYSIIFRDCGAVGRMPVLVPVAFDGDMPVFGTDKKVPDSIEVEDLKPGYEYASLTGSDDFKKTYGHFGFAPFWQFDHEPDMSLVDHDASKGTVKLTIGKTCVNLMQANNTLTQRTMYPGCAAEITVDGSGLKDGDYAGLCLLESNYGFIALTRREGKLYIVTVKRTLETDSFWGERHDKEKGEETALIPAESETVRFRADASFAFIDDKGHFSYRTDSASEGSSDGNMTPLGSEVKLEFRLDHFTGVRFGLFAFGTKSTGGSAVFSDFVME